MLGFVDSQSVSFSFPVLLLRLSPDAISQMGCCYSLLDECNFIFSSQIQLQIRFRLIKFILTIFQQFMKIPFDFPVIWSQLNLPSLY